MPPKNRRSKSDPVPVRFFFPSESKMPPKIVGSTIILVIFTTLHVILYYYAVVECDLSTTTNYIYKECDGLEVMQSSNALDLRFIPDNMEFKHPPRNLATEVPTNYEGKDFYSRALQHSKLAQLELNEFLTSDESESDDDEGNNETNDQSDKKAKKWDKYHALLQDNKQFWEAYLRKRREKKKAEKNKAKYFSDDADSDTEQEAAEDADDFFVEEPTVKKNKKAKSKDGEEPKLQNMDVGEKRDKAIDERKIPSTAYDDSRFAALFSPEYAIEPTDPQFKRSATYARQLAQKQQKDNMDLSAEGEHMKLERKRLSSDDSGMMKGQDEGLDPLKSRKDTYELSSLVKSIKMKSKQVQLPFDGKTRKDKK
ncbi:hypothetical protein RJT34_30575 [Clitoria ternatea]|uniref:Uncharacterized protein n=1 Tax=Clitoria ternatea TaxID=43366 RepID=A0AAN9I7H8_CLITE